MLKVLPEDMQNKMSEVEIVVLGMLTFVWVLISICIGIIIRWYIE